MLVSFSVSNFRSIGEEVTLNMVASNKLTDHEGHRVPIPETGKHVLRAAVLYGANAAGKSNLVKAIAAAQRLILDRGERLSSIAPFRFRPDQLPRQPTSFEFRFLVSDRVFIYGFDILSNRFTSEWLSVLKGSEEVELFQRDEHGVATVSDTAQRLFPDDAVTFNTLKLLKPLPLRKDQLFLNRANELPEDVRGATLKSIINWFADELVVLQANSRACDILDRLHKDASFKAFCAQFLSSVGTGVGELSIQESERDGEEYECTFLSHFGKDANMFSAFGCEGDTDIRLKPDSTNRVIVRKLLAQHVAKSGKYMLPFAEESDGTQAILHLMPALSSPPAQSRIVVIDELDRSLHPLICWEFIRFFSEACPGARKQLVVTTHEAHLLDQDLLRRDEYWFVEKDSSQQSQLTSLSDFNIRKDLQVQKGYLHGRFGGIPIIGGMHELEKLLDCADQGEETDAAKTSST